MKIKICGITSVEDALLATTAGADAIGLNFYPGSRRAITPATASEIVRALPPFVEPVGVFINESPARVRDMAEHVGLRSVQLHGDEPADVIAELSDFRLIRAVRVGSSADLAKLDGYMNDCRRAGRIPDAILVDAHVDGHYGGTGTATDWNLLRDWNPAPPLILAGGLTPDNVTDAIRTARPWAVDVASGVESSPGRKDPDKLRDFIHRARAAFASLNQRPLGLN